MPTEVPTLEEHQALVEEAGRLRHDVDDVYEQLAQKVHEVWTLSELRKAIDYHAEHGTAGTIHIAPGEYLLGAPLVLPSYVRLVGAGTGATSLRAGSEMDHLVTVADYASSVSIEKLRLDCAGKARTGARIVPAPRQPPTLDYGITAPDPRHRMFDVEVYDAAHTGVVVGEHARGTRLDHVLVRRAGTVGFNCSMADSFIVNCEATVVGGTAYSGASAFWIGAVNSVFANCKGWWGRGSGWRVRGTRNRFVACEAQDTAWHGWYIEYDKNTFTACVAENAGFPDAGGVPNTVDGFYLTGAGSNTLGGCHSRNRTENAKVQRHGFSVIPDMLQPLPDSGSKTPRLYGESGYWNIGKLVNIR